MLMPCETIMKEFLPAIRAGVTKELTSKYSYTQTVIASKLGITQAAVSKYLTGDYTDKIKDLEKNAEIRKVIDSLTAGIIKGKVMKKEIVENVCRACEQFFDENWNCTIGEIVIQRSENRVRA